MTTCPVMRPSRSSWIGIFVVVTMVHLGLIAWLIFYLNPVFLSSREDAGVVYPSFTSGEISSIGQQPSEEVPGKALTFESMPDDSRSSTVKTETSPLDEATSVSQTESRVEPQAEPQAETIAPSRSLPETSPTPEPTSTPKPAVRSDASSEVRPDSTKQAVNSGALAVTSPQSVAPTDAVTARSPMNPPSANASSTNADLSSADSTGTPSANTPSSASTDTVILVTKLDYAEGPPQPVYPSRAKQAAQEGKVIVRVTINQHGELESLQVRQSSGVGLLDDAAKQAVQRVRFRPYTVNGVPMRAMADIPFDFVLNP